jgi:predicted dienelactone hydrolase
MPPTEVALVLVTVAAAACVLLGVAATRLRQGIALAALAVALAAQLALVGPHWQVIPAYGGLLLVAALLRLGDSGWGVRVLAGLAVVLCCATLALLWALPMFRLPPPTGVFAVGTSGPLNWSDPSRALDGSPATVLGKPRELTVQIWYPAAPGSTGERARYARFRELSLGHSYEAAIRTNAILNAPIADAPPFPVILFEHRWAGARTQDTFLVEDLASHGYVVVALDHPLNSARVQLSDGSVVKSDRADALSNLEASSAAAIQALWLHELDLWTADDDFVLDTLFRDETFGGRVDLDRVGAVGHSFGGAVSMRLLGLDPRVKCAVNLDGWTFQGLERRTDQPVLFVYEGSGELRPPPVGVEGALNTADNAAVDGTLQRYGGLRAWVAGTQHLDFTDQTLTSPLHRVTFTGPIAGERIRTITRGLVLGFLDQTLRGSGQVPEFPEVKMEHWPKEKPAGIPTPR